MANHIRSLRVFTAAVAASWCLACSGVTFHTPANPPPKASPGSPGKGEPDGGKRGSDDRHLRVLAKLDCDGHPMCEVIAAAGPAKLPKKSRLRVGVALGCAGKSPQIYPVLWRGDSFVSAGADLMALELGEDGTAAIFTADATHPSEEKGIRDALNRVEKCTKGPCSSVALEAELHSYITKKAPRKPRTLERDEQGHLLGSVSGTLPIAITRATIGDRRFFIVVETSKDTSETCSYLNVFPDVPVKRE